MQVDRAGTALSSFIVGTALAGGNAVGVRVSNRELDPLWGAGLRFLLAACLLGAVMAVMRLTLPRGRALLGVLLYGSLIFGGAFSFAYYALVRIHAGLGQTLLALVPLATLLLAVVQRQERLRLAAVIGTLLCIAGIGVISGVSGQESVPMLSLLATLAAVLCFAQATVLVRHFPSVHPVTTNAVGMITGATILVTLSLLLKESIVVPERGTTWLALAYMIVLGSGPVFVLYVVVVRLWGASRAAYTFVLIPLVTVLLSAWIDDEPIGAELVFGGPLVLAGVYVGALRPNRADRASRGVASGGQQHQREGVTRMASLYDRLGGLEAITAVVDSFVGRCADDDRIKPKFAQTDVPRLKKMLIDQVCEASGGPCTYTGRTMRETHDGMGVTAGEFDALVEDLVATLDEFEVPRAEQDELLGLLGPMRDDIVEIESPETGTPLPETYQPAPALR